MVYLGDVLMSFWGPNMQAVLDWAHSQPDYPSGKSVAEFVSWMDQKTGIRHPENGEIERVAGLWLAEIHARHETTSLGEQTTKRVETGL